jgi:hypothetical protein
MRPEKQKNRTCIGPHRRRPQFAKILMISVREIGYVRRSEISKAHDEWPPFVGVDAVGIAIPEDRWGQKNPLNAHLEDDRAASYPVVVLGKVTPVLDLGFEVNGAFELIYAHFFPKV